MSEAELLTQARQGDREALGLLLEGSRPALRAVLRRLVGHPDEVDDLIQDALAKAAGSFMGFRGDAKFSSWVCAIGTRLAVDHLRRAKRWRERAQIVYANECLSRPELGMEVGEVMSGPDFQFDVREHIAYCFTCVGRSLPPEEHAAVVLRDVLDYDNAAGARVLGLNLGAFRHRLADGRARMQSAFEGLCALVSKQGACWQCAGLREAAGAERAGDDPPDLSGSDAVESFRRRLPIVRDAMLGGSVSVLHDVFYRRTAELESSGAGDAAPGDCGKSA